MSKEYEKLRVEIAKKYKQEINSLRTQNILLSKKLNEVSKENDQLKTKLHILENQLDRQKQEAPISTVLGTIGVVGNTPHMTTLLRALDAAYKDTSLNGG